PASDPETPGASVAYNEDGGDTGAAGAGARVLEPDADLRQRISAAFELGAQRGSTPPVIVANLLVAPPAALDRASADGNTPAVVGYVATDGRSRVIGPVRCFAQPPTATGAVAALAGDGGAKRRVMTFSADFDSFLPTKTALTNAGHSVSMACDA